MSGFGTPLGITEEDVQDRINESAHIIIDQDSDTYVSVETTPGSDEDTISFVVRGELVATLTDGSLRIIDNDSPDSFPRLLFQSTDPGGNFSQIGHINGGLFLSASRADSLGAPLTADVIIRDDEQILLRFYPDTRDDGFTDRALHGASNDGLLNQSRILVPGQVCLLYTSPSPRDRQKSRMPSSA